MSLSSSELGILSLIAGMVFSALAWVCWRKERYNFCLLFIVATGLSLRIFACSDQFLNMWDEAFHAIVAKNMLNSPLRPVLYPDQVFAYDFRDWQRNSVWLHKPPLTLWVIAASYFMFGVNEIALRLPSMVFSAAGIFLTYLIGEKLFSRFVGILAAWFHCFNSFLILLAAGREPTDHVDTLFIFLIELGIFFCVKQLKKDERGWRWLVAAGLVIGLAMLTKWATAFLIVAVFAGLFAGRLSWKQLAVRLFLLVVLALGVSAPWNIYINIVFPKEAAFENYYSLLHFIRLPEEGHTHGLFFHLDRMRDHFSSLIFVPLLWFVWYAFRHRSQTGIWGLIVWILLPYAIFTVAAAKMPAYPMIAAPGIFLVMALFCQQCLTVRAGRGIKMVMAGIVAIFVIVTALDNAQKLDFWKDYDRSPAWVAALKKVNSLGPSPKVVFMKGKGVQSLFYTPYQGYRFIPNKKQVELVKKKGYALVVIATEPVPEWLCKEPSVTVIRPGG